MGRSDVVDFRDEVVFNKERKLKVDKGYIDISGLVDSSNSLDEVSRQQESKGISNFKNNAESISGNSFSSFWDNVGSTSGTSASDVSNTINQSVDNSSNLSNLTNTSLSSFDNGSSGLDLQNLKVKLDDMEYKLDRFIEKIDLIESKMNE